MKLSLHDDGTVLAEYEGGGETKTREMEWEEFLELETPSWDTTAKEIEWQDGSGHSTEIKIKTWQKIIDAAKKHKGVDE